VEDMLHEIEAKTQALIEEKNNLEAERETLKRMRGEVEEVILDMVRKKVSPEALNAELAREIVTRVEKELGLAVRKFMEVKSNAEKVMEKLKKQKEEILKEKEEAEEILRKLEKRGFKKTQGG
ncbi:MAG: hypothetical protein QXS83_03220, partial [Thermoplasmata archaeon]